MRCSASRGCAARRPGPPPLGQGKGREPLAAGQRRHVLRDLLGRAVVEDRQRAGARVTATVTPTPASAREVPSTTRRPEVGTGAVVSAGTQTPSAQLAEAGNSSRGNRGAIQARRAARSHRRRSGAQLADPAARRSPPGLIVASTLAGGGTRCAAIATTGRRRRARRRSRSRRRTSPAAELLEAHDLQPPGGHERELGVGITTTGCPTRAASAGRTRI